MLSTKDFGWLLGPATISHCYSRRLPEGRTIGYNPRNLRDKRSDKTLGAKSLVWKLKTP
jgi:hypothetical protein